MTKDDLEQYINLVKEKQDLEKRISKGQVVSDIVTGSSADYPYTQHPISISGAIHDAKLSKLYIQQRDELAGKCVEIEEWMLSVDDSLVRLAIRHKYESGLTWRETAQRIGGYNTEDSVRKAVERYLQKS